MKRALSLLRNNKSEDPDTIKKGIFKIRGRSKSNFTKGLFLANTTIRVYINSMELISFDQHRQRSPR